jgi:hypothetical protein
MSDVVIIKTDGTVEAHKLSGDLTADFNLIRNAVEGFVERVPISDYTQLMWVNEEGKLRGLPHNPKAQTLWDSQWGAGTDRIVGNVVITGDDTEEGETGTLPEGEAERLVALLS